MYMMQDAYSKYITSIYFVLAVVICAFFLINLTIAIMLKNYDELDKNEKNTTHQANLIEIGMQAKLPSKLIYFIVQEENLIVSKKASKRLKDTGEQQNLKHQLFRSFVYTKIEMPHDGYYKSRITRSFYFLVQLPLFSTLILFCILLNTIFLSLERYPMPEAEQQAYERVNYVFSAIFGIELILKVIGLSPRKFIIDKFNIFDAVIVLVSLLELFVSSGSGGVSALRAFRLFRIFKLFRTGNLRVLLDSIAYTMGTIGNYVILLGLFIYVYSLLGMQFFAGQLKFNKNGEHDPNGEVSRANFDTIYWASITVFEILIGDNWNEVMYDCIKSVGLLSTVYFISLILFGTIIMLNLFLAILLGNFDKARKFWLKKSIFEMFETATARNYSLNKAISIILGDVNKTVRDELLVHEPKDIYRINGRLMIINRKLMENDPEQQDRLVYLDKIAAYELTYDPIIEFIHDEFEGLDEIEEGESGDEDEITFKKQNLSNQGKKNNFLKEQNNSVNIDPEIHIQEEKKALDESGYGLVDERKPSYSAMLNKNEIHLKPIIVAKSPDDLMSKKNHSVNFSSQPNLHFMTLGTPREKVEDLEEMKLETAQLLDGNGKILNKSVTFDVRKIDQNDMGQLMQGDESDSEETAQKEVEDPFDDAMLVPVKKSAWNSSLGIFHKDWRCRKFIIQLVVSPETSQEYIQKKKDDAPLDTLPNEPGDSMKGDKILKSMKSKDTSKLEEVKSSEPTKKIKSQMLRSDHEILDHMRPKSAKTLKLTDSQIRRELQEKQKSRHPSKYFDYIIILLIVLSSILLILDNPLNDPESSYSKVLSFIDYVFTFLFAIEACIKIVGLGFFFSSIQAQPYIRNGWNILDFIVVVASLTDFFVLIQNTDSVDTGQLKSLKALRALRALRPLRMISRNEGMRLVVNALFASIPSMTNVLIVCLLFILIFASAGISFFAGQFFYCYTDSDTGVNVNLKTVYTKEDCITQGGEWRNADSNFDNVFAASLTLFEMMTTEGWLTVMYSGIDARGIDLQPKKNQNIVFALFFIAFMIVGSMLIINLFVGVVIDNFNKIKTNEELGNMFVTESQKKWIEIQRIIMRKKLKLQQQRPTRGVRLQFLNFAQNKWFDLFITLCILANTIIMSIKYARMSKTYENTLEYFNYVFAAVFNFEAAVKIIGFGKAYFYYSWNKFDLAIVIGTDIGLVMNVVNTGINISTVATVVRAFRIMRVFRLVKSSQNMRIILDTIAHIMPQVWNIMSLVFLLLVIYAVLGLNLFATVMYQDYYNERANFRTFGEAILLLLRCLTGENWNLIMKELAIKNDYNGIHCKSNQSYEDMQENGVLGCGNEIAYLYFISYMILLSMVIMNLSVAAVIEGLAEASKENMGIVSGDQIDFLIEKWKDYDTNASGLISYQDLLFLLYEVPPPLGLGKFTTYYSDSQYTGGIGIGGNDEEDKKDDLKNMNNIGLQDRYIIHEGKKIYIKKSDAIKIFNDYAVPMYDQNVHFKDVAKALVEKIFKKNKLSYDLTGKINNRLNKQWEGKYNALKKISAVRDIDTGNVEAGKAILKFYKRAKGNNEITTIKRGKSIYNKRADGMFGSSSKKKHILPQEEMKIDEDKTFTRKNIEKFIEKGDTEDVKDNEQFDPFRFLMNDKNLVLDQDLYATSNDNNKDSKNQFTWYKDPNFRMEGSSSDDEEMKTSQLLHEKGSLKPGMRSVGFPRKSQGPVEMSKLAYGARMSARKSRDEIVTGLETQLGDPKASKLFHRREMHLKVGNEKFESFKKT